MAENQKWVRVPPPIMNPIEQALEALVSAQRDVDHERTGMGNECYGDCPRCKLDAALARLRACEVVEGSGETDDGFTDFSTFPLYDHPATLIVEPQP